MPAYEQSMTGDQVVVASIIEAFYNTFEATPDMAGMTSMAGIAHVFSV